MYNSPVKYCVLVLVGLAVGCHTCPPTPPPSPKQFPDRPEDMTGKILMDEQIPDWLKLNYAEWVRYAYDKEDRDR